MHQLYPYQTIGKKALLANDRFILGDEMGLGKTVQVLMALTPEHLPAVVVCPASVRMVWADEVTKWRPELTTDVIETGKHKTKWGSDITITSYDLFGKVKMNPPRTVICDEAHYLQNRQARRTRVVAKASADRRTWFLTGTPMWSKPKSLYVLVKLCGAWKGGYQEYAEQFCDAGWKYNPYTGASQWDDSGASNLGQLNRLLAPIMLRRMKADVLKDLPQKTRQIIKVAGGISDQEKKVDSFDPKSVCDGWIPPGPIATAIRETAVLKVPAMLEHIKLVLASEHKVVIFAWNIDVMDMLAGALRSFGVVRIDGGVKLKDRWAAVKRFQQHDDTRVFIGQTIAAGTGLTLTAASTVIFAQPDWTPANLMQAEDRVHRISQDRKVLVQYLVTKGSIEEAMLSNVLSKMRIAEQVLKTKETGFDEYQEE
jgi:SWI/SNF-related matrix-associated actin-dependent regulator of chromatin subfamily A-like protein 1